MESGAIPVQQITASSEWDKNHAAGRARLNIASWHRKVGAWLAKYRDLNQWIQVDFGRNVKITKFATQGRSHHHQQWVTSYTLSYSVDGATDFEVYQENNNEKVTHRAACQQLHISP